MLSLVSFPSLRHITRNPDFYLDLREFSMDQNARIEKFIDVEKENALLHYPFSKRNGEAEATWRERRELEDRTHRHFLRFPPFIRQGNSSFFRLLSLKFWFEFLKIRGNFLRKRVILFVFFIFEIHYLFSKNISEIFPSVFPIISELIGNDKNTVFPLFQSDGPFIDTDSLFLEFNGKRLCPIVSHDQGNHSK